MRINLSCDADITKLSLKRDDETGDKVATVTLALLLDEDATSKSFGVAFADMAFRGLRLNNPEARYAQLKPLAVFEQHQVAFGGREAVPTIPAFDKIEPAGGSEIRVYLKLPVVIDSVRLASELVMHFGEPIAFAVSPSQLGLAVA